jgi:hypothetical protein
LVTAAIGMSRMIAARRRSLTTMTSFWSQRSTKVPAMGDRSRFGNVAKTNTNATAIGEWVTASTRNASAIWWTRSPNKLMS